MVTTQLALHGSALSGFWRLGRRSSFDDLDWQVAVPDVLSTPRAWHADLLNQGINLTHES